MQSTPLLSSLPGPIWTGVVAPDRVLSMGWIVSWECRIHRPHICRGLRPHPHNECPGYDTKQSDGEVPVILELWGMQSNPSLRSLPDPLWPRVVAPDRVLSTKPWFREFTFFFFFFAFKLRIYAQLNCLK